MRAATAAGIASPRSKIPTKGAFIMARKSASKSARGAKRSRRRPATAATKKAAGFTVPGVNLADLSKMAKVLTPEQAFEMYRANARMALEVIDAAIESTARLRKLQFEGEEEA